ncbi:MAG: RagB/SusD family nutrient uptake outer membrane protein [Bacteroidia bacterium]
MKKMILIVTGLIFFSCNDDYLDQVPDDRLTFEETFSQRSTVERYLANIYSRVPSELDQRDTNSHSGPWLGASDEAEYWVSFHFGNFMDIGDWNAASGEVSDHWANYYGGIRDCSTLIQNIGKCANCSDDRTNQYVAEARILRAYFYYNLIRIYGPTILMGETPIPADADLSALNLHRNTMQECVDYITSELDIAAQALIGVSFKDDNAGRMSRPFALAIKEKTLLLNASPLFNGNKDYESFVDEDGKNLISQNTDVNKWQLAANAAKAFIDEYVPNTYDLHKEYDNDGTYNPYLSTRNVMIIDWNEEMIYARPRGGISYHYDVTPYHSGHPDEVHGAGGLAVTQEMVDAYFTANGRSIDDPASGYQQSGFSDFKAPFDYTNRRTYNQWVNREPRFYVGVTYNESLWLNRDFGNIVTATWYYGNSGRYVGSNDYTPTGYVVRKSMITGNKNNTNRTIPMMRLAEIYLDYAEALNESDPGNADILLYLNKIRERAGVPEYGSAGLEIPASQSQMREAIHKERRVELAFENVRYFDVRRWKEGIQEFGGAFHGMDINATNENDFYRLQVFEQRIFNQRHYLWPIPQVEMNTNRSLIQNPGW